MNPGLCNSPRKVKQERDIYVNTQQHRPCFIVPPLVHKAINFVVGPIGAVNVLHIGRLHSSIAYDVNLMCPLFSFPAERDDREDMQLNKTTWTKEFTF